MSDSLASLTMPVTAGATVDPSTISALSSTASTTQVGATANDSQMNEFLQLLVAQLKNQDPTQPTDPTQFVAQLAQFSTVEQLVNSNSTLGNISTSVSGLDMGQYAGLIGKPVDGAVSEIAVPASGSPSAMTFDVTSTGATGLNVVVTNSAGNIVRSIPVTGTTGTVPFDGTNGSGTQLPAGDYSVVLQGTQSGTTITAGTVSMTGTVSAVQQGSAGAWELQLQDGSIVNASSVNSVLASSSSS